MDKLDTMELLAISSDAAPANQILSLLRHEGFTVHLQHVKDLGELKACLAERPRDLLLLFGSPANPTPEQVLDIQARLQDRTPTLYIQTGSGQRKRGELMEAGISEWVDIAEPELVVRVVTRLVHAQQTLHSHRQMVLELRTLRAQLEDLLHQSPQAIAYIADGIHIYCNPAYSEFCQYSGPDELLDRPLLDLVADDDRENLKALLLQDPSGQEASLALLTAAGEKLAARLHFTSASYAGQSCLRLQLSPAPGNEDYAREVADIDRQDLLTRLDKRQVFMTRLENAIRRAVTEGVYSCLLLVRLDEIADLHSLSARSSGNMVLNEISQFLRTAINKPFAAGRLDTFVFGLLVYDGNISEAFAMADFIRDSVNSRLSQAALPGASLHCSIGLASINGNALDASTLLAQASTNLHSPLHTAQNSDLQNFHIGSTLEPSMEQILDYFELALENKLFRLLFQPIVNIQGAGFSAYEVFTRVLDEDGNDIPPMVFIPAANMHGLGEKFDRIIIGHLLESIAREANPSLALTLNVTSNTVISKTFLPWLRAKLGATGVDPALLVFKISEIDLHEDREHILSFSQDLDELGLKKTLTHFGCALEPLKELDAIRPAYVTLDHSLIGNLAYSEQHRDNIRDLVRELHQRQYLVAAPNIEDIDTLPVLWELGIDLAQGFGLQRPSQEMNYEFIQEQEITLDAKPAS